MTLEEIKTSNALFLTPRDIAPVLECDPQKIRTQAHTDPAMLGFPVSVIGTRVKIPRKPFISFVEGTDPEITLH